LSTDNTGDVLVSVVTPYYNTHEYIEKALGSLEKQTFSNWEWIIIDDGSEEASYQKLNEIVSDQPKVRLVRHENAGQGAARNRGVREAGADIVAFLDSDDWFSDTKLQRQFEAISKDDVDVVFTGMQEVGNGRKGAEEIKPLKDSKGTELLGDLIKSNRYVLSSCMIRKSVFDAVSGFSEDRGYRGTEDYHLWLKLAREGYRFHYIEELLTYYLVRGDSEMKDVARNYDGTLTAIMEVSAGIDTVDLIVEMRLKQMIPRLLYRALWENDLLLYQKWMAIGKQRNLNLTIAKLIRFIPWSIRRPLFNKLYHRR
jgi:teichuronic acid biosynthesis glycosyltransferase TuaG